MREAERAATAAAYGPVRLRLHFPGGLLVQAAFQARDTLADVKVRAAAAGEPQHGEKRGGQAYSRQIKGRLTMSSGPLI
jgi:hypothetical protein